MSNSTPTATPVFQDGAQLLIYLFLQICGPPTLERVITLVSNGAIVTFLAGPYERRAMRLCRREGSMVIEFHSSSGDAKADSHEEHAYFELGVNFRPPMNGSVIERAARGSLNEQRFFCDPRMDLGQLRNTHSKGLPFFVLFVELLEGFPYDYAWDADLQASWTAGMKQIQSMAEPSAFAFAS